MQLPFFPTSTKMISDCWGVFEKDDFVYYIHVGLPVYVHSKDDMATYRYVTGTLVHLHACSPSQLSKIFKVNKINFIRYTKKLKEGGSGAFFNAEDNRGKCHKMLEDKLQKAQELLDKGYSHLKTAKEIGVNEATIRYHLKSGNLKKNNPINTASQPNRTEQHRL